MVLSLINLKNYWSKWYGVPEFFELVKKGYIVDARLGGLVNGPSHLMGGIFCYSETASLFEVQANIEGGEFIVNPLSTKKHLDRLHVINNDVDTRYKKVKKSQGDAVFNIGSNRKQALWLSYGGVYIINAKSTAKYYDELVSLNSLDTIKYEAKAMNSKEWERCAKLDNEGRFYSSIGENENDFIKKIKAKEYLSTKLYG